LYNNSLKYRNYCIIGILKYYNISICYIISMYLSIKFVLFAFWDDMDKVTFK